MKTADALIAHQTIQQMISDQSPKTVQFNFALIKNKRALEPVVQQYNASLAADRDDVFDQLIRRWRELAPPYAVLQKNGQPKMDANGNIIIAPDRLIEYNLACEQILLEQPTYREAFDRRNALAESLQQVEIDVALYPIALSWFPNNTDVRTLEILVDMIDGEQ